MEEEERRSKTMLIPKDIAEKVTKYNRWVDEVREKAKQWKPKQPEYGKRTPFRNSDVYYLTKDKDLERYPELARMDEESEKQEEVEEYLGKYYKHK